MVQIPQYTQQVGIDAPSRSIPNVQQADDGGIGQGIRNLGSALGDIQQQVQARNDRKDEFNAKVNYDKYQENMQAAHDTLAQNAAADGTGFHDQLLSERSKIAGGFLETIHNPVVREQYRTVLDNSDAAHWSRVGGETEHKMGNAYTTEQTQTMWDRRSQGIAQSPAEVKSYVDDMVTTIDKAPNLSPAEKETMKAKVREQGPKIAAEALKTADPETLYYASGRGTNEQRVGFLTRRLTPAVIQAESAGNPNAVSPVGAVGLMQIMPDTAVEIATKLGDKAFLAMPRAQQIEALKDPGRSKLYGSTYLGTMVAKYHGDVEAALVAYNAGPGNADKWLAAGRDYGALPKASETQPYVQRVLGNMGAAKLASGGNTKVADASGTGGLPTSDAGPQSADGVPGGGDEARSGFVSPAFADMSGGDLLNVQSASTTAFTKAAQAQLAQDTADQILSAAGATDDAAGDSKAAYSALDAIKDAETRKDVATLIDSHFTRWDHVEKDQNEKEYTNVRTAVDERIAAGDTTGAYKLLKTSSLKGEDFSRLETRISKGATPFDNPASEQYLLALKQQDPERFVGLNLARDFGHQLTDETIAKMTEQQTTVKNALASKADSADKSLIETSKSANPIIDDNLQAIGIPTTGAKATPADAQHANLIRSMVGKELEIRQQAKGKPLLMSEIQDTVNSVMKTYPRFKPVESSWKHWTKADSDVSMPEVLDAFDGAKMDINMAADALRRKGKPVNPATLQQTLEDYLALQHD